MSIKLFSPLACSCAQSVIVHSHTVRMSDFKFHSQAKSFGTSHVYATLVKYKTSKQANLAMQ